MKLSISSSVALAAIAAAQTQLTLASNLFGGSITPVLETGSQSDGPAEQADRYEKPLIVSIQVASQADIQHIANRYEILDANEGDMTVTALVSLAEKEQLEGECCRRRECNCRA